MEHESWITDVYQEFWKTAEKLAQDETGELMANSPSKIKRENRQKHLDAMVAMFIATMESPVSEEDCGGEDVGTCDQCTDLERCQERWRITKQN